MSCEFKKNILCNCGRVVALALLYFSMTIKKKYNQPIGGWDELKAKVEKRYLANPDEKNAALQIAKALQEAIDYPHRAAEIRPTVSKAFSCFHAVLKNNGHTWDFAYDESEVIEDLATSTFERQRRYIAYNVALSGGVYRVTDDSLESCSFQLKGGQ